MLKFIQSLSKVMIKVFIKTWGCTLNQSDSDLMEGILREKGCEIVNNIDEADVIVLNTCTVKGATENKILEEIKNLERKKKKFVIAGCLTINKNKIRKISNAPLLGAGATNKIFEAVESALKSREFESFEIRKKNILKKIFSYPIARIPISEGCVGFCNFCQTKFARPKLISYSEKEIILMVEESLKRGAKEIQLTAMDTGAYGLDIGTDVADLLNKIVNVEGDFKVRLGMINPEHAKRLKNKLLNVFENEKIYKFLHLPVQTGSEKVCKEMGRMHSVKDFEEVVSKFKEKFSNLTLATDIIVGYPTETDEDFEETIKLLERVRPDIVNISRFTPRDFTKAKELKQLKTQIVKERVKKLSSIVKKIETENAQKFIGKELKVLITEIGKENQIKGRAENYRQVVIEGGKNLLGKFVNVKIFKASYTTLFGYL